MAIKRTIIKKDAQVKALPLKKIVVSVKKNETTLTPEEAIEEVITETPTEEVIEAVEEVESHIPIIDNIEEYSELKPIIEENQNKLANEKRFAKIALAVGIGILVIILLNKK